MKGKRVETPGSQLPEVTEAFRSFKRSSDRPASPLVKVIGAEHILDGNEWSPQQYIDNLLSPEEAFQKYRSEAVMELYKAVVTMPELADETIEEFPSAWFALPDCPLSHTASIDTFFEVVNGKSQGEKHYTTGVYPYVSSGDATNSIIRLVEADESEVFMDGGISVTAFGQACLQPWPFVARGNGGSAVRVLVPRYSMSLAEMLWFVSQINFQRWRFFYGRMAIKFMLERLHVSSPGARLADNGEPIHNRLVNFQASLYRAVR